MPLLRRSFFQGVAFYSKEQVEQVLLAIPNSHIYTECPVEIELDPEKEKGSNGRSLTRAERSQQSKEAKILLLGDSRKAAAISQYTKEQFNRKLVSTEGFGNLCLYSAALNQLSNSEYTFHPQSGEQFSPLDLKHAMLHFMGMNYELLYPVVAKHLEVSYKQWCLDHLQDNTPGDLVAVTSLRYLLNVSTIYICQEFRTAFIPSAISTGIPYGILTFNQCACTAFLPSFYRINRNVQHLVSHS